jgi:hypothetical protein
MTTLEYGRGATRRQRLVWIVPALLVVAAVTSWLIFQLVPKRPSLTRMHVYAVDEMRRTSVAAGAFRHVNGRLPESLGELRASPQGAGLTPGRWERKLKITWLGQRGNDLDILAFCFPAENGPGGVVLLRQNLTVAYENWQPFVDKTRREVEALAERK